MGAPLWGGQRVPSHLFQSEQPPEKIVFEKPQEECSKPRGRGRPSLLLSTAPHPGYPGLEDGPQAPPPQQPAFSGEPTCARLCAKCWAQINTRHPQRASTGPPFPGWETEAPQGLVADKQMGLEPGLSGSRAPSPRRAHTRKRVLTEDKLAAN